MAVRGKALLAPLWWSLCWSGAADEPRAPPAASPTAAELAPEVARVRGLCAPLWSDPSAECMAALDRIYLDRDVTLNYHSEALRDPAEGVTRTWGPKPLRDDLVWRHVFEDPLALRRMVEAAMADPQCLAMRGEVRHRLREVCAADAFARLSVLHFACGRILYWDGHELHDGWPAEWARERRHLKEDAQSPDDYAWRLATLNESELHFAWRLTKCRAVSRRAMERIVALQLPSHHTLGRYQHMELLQVATRLGSLWANTLSGGDGAELNAIAKSSLALAYVRRALVYSQSRMYLPYLLAAREYDRRADRQLDWSGLEERFTAAEIDLARPTLEGILRQGWRPMEEYLPEQVTSPWAIAPPVVKTWVIRQRLDQAGNVRWIDEGGNEEWLDSRGRIRMQNADGSEVIMYHGPLTDRQRPHLLNWVDEHGRPRWLDNDGAEHWIDADGAEHWITFGGTEWILLPLDPSPDGGPRQ